MEMMDISPISMDEEEIAVHGQNLPNDLITEIIKLLPVKSLVRFRCASKYWSALIKSPHFIKGHLLKQQERDPTLLLVWQFLQKPDNTGVFSFHDPESPELKEVCPNLRVPFQKEMAEFFPRNTPYFTKNIRLYGPCNGLVCMFFDGSVALCNPSLREYKELPQIRLDHKPPDDIVLVGQGFGNTSTDDYKVVKIWRFRKYGARKCQIHVYVCNLRNNSWRKFDSDPAIVPAVSHPYCQIFFDEICHWNSTSPMGNTMLTLDLSTDELKRLEYPDCVAEMLPENTYPYLMIIDESLGFLRPGSMKSTIEVWVMKVYGVKESWTKQYVIGPYPAIRPLVCWKKGEWLLAEREKDSQLVSCAFTKKKMNRFEIHGIFHSMRALLYKESLISLDEVMTCGPTTELG